MSAELKSQGSLAGRDLPELLCELFERRWTGSLTLTHAGVGKSIKVHQGRMVFASSTSRDDRLGELLLRQGKVTLRQIADAAEHIAPGKRLGAILVERGLLEPKELIRAVVDHTQEIIYGAFLWTEGQYLLQEGEASSEDITLRISTPDLILEGIRRITAWSRISRGVGELEARYERCEDYERVVAQMSLSTEQLALVTELHEPQNVEAICAASSLPDFEVCQALWAFRVISVVRRVDQLPETVDTMEDEGLGLVLSGE